MFLDLTTVIYPHQSKDEPSGDKMDTLEPQKDGDNKMDTSDAAKRDDKEDDSDKATAAAKPEVKKDGEKKTVEPEPEFLMLSNPARVLPAQVSIVSDMLIMVEASSHFFAGICCGRGGEGGRTKHEMHSFFIINQN